jgi:hypothetical protein
MPNNALKSPENEENPDKIGIFFGDIFFIAS